MIILNITVENTRLNGMTPAPTFTRMTTEGIFRTAAAHVTHLSFDTQCVMLISIYKSKIYL